jgi:hypothetical protein
MLNEISPISRILAFYMPESATFKIKKSFVKLTFCLLTLLFANTLQARKYQFHVKLIWKNKGNHTHNGQFFSSFYVLENGILAQNGMPHFSANYKLNTGQIFNLKVEPTKITTILAKDFQLSSALQSNLKIDWQIGLENGLPVLMFQLLPAYSNLQQIVLVNEFELLFETNDSYTQPVILQKAFKTNSVFATGNWYKIATTNNGMHRIDFGFLRSIGINPDDIDPRNIQLYGRGAGMQPTPNNEPRIDDLEEIPIRIIGEEDGRFNNNDLLLFYGQSQINNWLFNKTNQTYSHVTNLYADTVYYYLTIGASAGKRVIAVTPETNPNISTNEQDFLFVYENERLNLIKSGKIWVGEEFDRVLTQQFRVNIPFLVTGKPVRFSSSVTARSFVPSVFTVTINGINAVTHNCPQVPPNYDAPFTSGLNFQTTALNLNNADLTIQYTFNKPGSASVGWLDYFTIQATSELRNLNGNFVFRHAASVGLNNVTRFSISTPRNITIWDITNPINPFEVPGTFASNTFEFVVKSDSLRVFAAYDGSSYHIPRFAGTVNNQNIHGLPFADVFIVTPNQFMQQAQRLAQHHRETRNFKVHVLDIQDVYNEFSGGVQDITAVRELMRLFYKRATTDAEKPKYLVIFGRASYDYKNRIPNNTNHVPTFQSWQSFSPTASYCSDDFYGFLDDNEGRWDIGADNPELLDIGIGRLPVANAEQANAVVDKIIRYSQQDAMGDWRNRITFVADDEDFNLHQNQSNRLADRVAENKWLNIEKIFVDAYREVTVAGGKRNYDAQNAIVRSVDRGCLIINYTGHGGEIGWSKKRILEMQDIKNWRNRNALPLFVTATCEFSRFDDPARQAAGEEVIINANGGGIALFTTVRLVFSFSNDMLNNRFFDHAGLNAAALLNPPLLGDIMRRTKNSYTDRNTRNFTLLGDPAMMLAYPKHEVKTTAINNIPVTSFNDTLKALSKVTISGIVTDRNGNTLTDFNGEVFPTVFDKLKTFQTISNNATSPQMNFNMQNSILHRGRATVRNGVFTFSFVMPKDINYSIGPGKISYYVKSLSEDGTGYDTSILIGATADSVDADRVGPQIKVYLNDEKFVNGGLTNSNPLLLAKLFDDNGINTTGQGIGRDITAILNNDNAKSIVLNDYFTADLDSYQSGTLRYNLRDLPQGNHTLKIRAFDVFNNPSEQEIQFNVAENENAAVKNLLNYPNPFTTFTTFHFDHNKAGEQIDVMLQIFTVSGKLVKTLSGSWFTTGNHFDQLSWDATDDFGDRLANGVYIYKLTLKPQSGKNTSKIEKLMIIK